MQEFLHSPLFKVAAPIVVLLILGRVIWKLVFPPGPGSLHLRVICSSCGWKGTVGKYAKKCSSCGSTALEMVK